MGIWARTSSLYTDFQYPLPAFSTISLIPLPSFLTSASHFCSSQGFCQVDQIPSCWYPLPSDSKTWAFLLAGKLFLVPLSTSNLHILWSGATDNSLLHQTRSSILGFWFLEEGKGYNMSWLSHPETTNLTLRWMAHNWSLPSTLTVCLKLTFGCFFFLKKTSHLSSPRHDFFCSSKKNKRTASL